MEDDTWSFGVSVNSTSSTRSYQSSHLKALSDICSEFVEIEEDEDEDMMAEYPCPFCSNDFDLVELCRHVDEDHRFDDNYGVCPVCGMEVDVDMVGHITMLHGNILKGLHRLKSRRGEPYSGFSFVKKELDDGYLRSLLAESSMVDPSKLAPDPLLSFLYNVPPSNKPESVESAASTEATLEEQRLDEKLLERNANPSPLSEKEHMEKANRSQFVQGLVMSTIFDEDF